MQTLFNIFLYYYNQAGIGRGRVGRQPEGKGWPPPLDMLTGVVGALPATRQEQKYYKRRVTNHEHGRI